MLPHPDTVTIAADLAPDLRRVFRERFLNLQGARQSGDAVAIRRAVLDYQATAEAWADGDAEWARNFGVELGGAS